MPQAQTETSFYSLFQTFGTSIFRLRSTISNLIDRLEQAKTSLNTFIYNNINLAENRYYYARLCHPTIIVRKCYVQVHHFGGKDNYLYFVLKRPSIIFRMLTNGLFHQYH